MPKCAFETEPKDVDDGTMHYVGYVCNGHESDFRNYHSMIYTALQKQYPGLVNLGVLRKSVQGAIKKIYNRVQLLKNDIVMTLS